MAGKITTNSVQLGDSATATQNFVLQTMLDGTAKLSRGNLGATTQDVLTVNSLGKVTLLAPPVVPAQSMVRLNTANGYGSTNTKIRRFTNVVTNQGVDITYADSAALGASFTINTNGVYAISYTDVFTTSISFGVSLNSNQLTTDINLVTISNVLTLCANPSGTFAVCATTVYLIAGDVIRPHVAAGTSAGTQHLFTITRVA